MTVVAASLANLRPPWNRETRPQGAKTANHGASIVEWINRLGHMEEDQVRKIAVDPAAPIAKRKAAKSHLRSLSDEVAKNGRAHAIEDLNLQLDRTLGKPVQHMEVVKQEVADPRALMVQFAALLADNPKLGEALGVQVAGALVDGATDPPGTPNEA